jgi:Fe2+ transport system protein B
MLGGYMAEISLDENKLKEILKTAIVEVIQERKEIFSDLLAEIIEDIALEKAIKEGENTESVSREAIFKLLDRQG